MNYIGYIGVGAAGKDGGLRVIEADGETGALRLIAQAGRINTTSSFAISDGLLVTTCTNPDAPSPRRGMLAALRIGDDGMLSYVNGMPTASGGAPCHVCVSPDGRYAYTSGYGDGQITVHSISEHGALWGPIQVVPHSGSGPHERQDAPHIHFGCVTPDGKYVLHCDLGLDVIHMYKPDENGVLSTVRDIPVIKGAGTRHMLFSRDGRFCWVVSEMACLVTAFAYHDGAFTMLGTVSTTRERPGIEQKLASAIKLSPDGSLVFIGNRYAANTVGVFSVGADGSLAMTAEVPCALPRNLALLPNGKFLCVSGQQDNRVEVFRVDYERKTLEKTPHSLTVPAPMSIDFLSKR